MGSGTSRGKRVAPARVSEVNVTTSPEQESRPLQIHARLRNARNRAQPDCHSEGHDSDTSPEEEDDDVEAGEMETFLTDRKAATRRPENTALRSQTYGLCQFTQEDDADPGSAPPSPAEEPRGSPGDVNKRRGDAFTAACPSPRSSSSRGFFTRGAFLDAVPTSGKQSGRVHSSAAMPVLLYDGSEEELMDTIEKEFSAAAVSPSSCPRAKEIIQNK